MFTSYKFLTLITAKEVSPPLWVYFYNPKFFVLFWQHLILLEEVKPVKSDGIKKFNTLNQNSLTTFKLLVCTDVMKNLNQQQILLIERLFDSVSVLSSCFLGISSFLKGKISLFGKVWHWGSWSWPTYKSAKGLQFDHCSSKEYVEF